MEQRIRLESIVMLSTLFLTLLAPFHVTADDSLFYHSSILIADDASGKNTVEIDSDGHVYASLGDTLYKFDAQGNILQERTFSSEILATSISPDDARLTLTLRSNSNGDDSVFVLSSSDLNTLVSSDATSTNAHLLEWSSNGASIFTNGPDEGLIQLNRETLEIDRTYSGNHTTNLVCFDVSNNAGNILTFDQDGLILLWDISTEQVVLEFQLMTTISSAPPTTKAPSGPKLLPNASWYKTRQVRVVFSLTLPYAACVVRARVGAAPQW